MSNAKKPVFTLNPSGITRVGNSGPGRVGKEGDAARISSRGRGSDMNPRVNHGNASQSAAVSSLGQLGGTVAPTTV